MRVHCLVSDWLSANVGSVQVAANSSHSLPILRPLWIGEAWTRAQAEAAFDAAATPFMNEFRCQTFAGLTISVSGFIREEREAMKQLIEIVENYKMGRDKHQSREDSESAYVTQSSFRPGCGNRG